MGDIATREAFGKTIAELGKDEKFYVLSADLAGSTKTDYFMRAFPERHIEAGIAEANMMCMAAGIASTGVRAVASTYAIFAAGRAYEQIRNSIAYPHLPVLIAASHAGLSVGADGASHQCCEDLALMRVLPGMTVLSPCDDIETAGAVRHAFKLDGPVYLRLSRVGTPRVNADDYVFEFGKGVVLRDGTDAVLVSTGVSAAEAIKAHDTLKAQGFSLAVINIHTVKPIDRELLVRYAKKTGRVFTIEEHSVIGGLGDAVSEAVAGTGVNVTRIGVDDKFGRSGEAFELLDAYGLTAPHVVKRILGK